MKLSACLLVFVSWTLAHAQSASQVPVGPEKTSKADSTKSMPASSQDSLIIAGEGDRISSARGGGSGSLDWVHTNNRGSTFTVGTAFFSIADSRWALVRTGVAFQPRERLVLNAGASLGPGRTPHSTFAYGSLNGGLAYKTWSRLYLKFEDDAMHVAQTRGNLLKTGATFVPADRLAADVTYARSVGGNLDTGFLSGRLEFDARSARVWGGGAAGHSTPDVFNLRVGGGAKQDDLQEAYLGLAIPLSSVELSVAADFLNLGVVRRRALTLGLKVPFHAPWHKLLTGSATSD